MSILVTSMAINPFLILRFKYQGPFISEALIWPLYSTQLMKKTHQWFHFLKMLWKTGMSPKTLSKALQLRLRVHPDQLHHRMVRQLRHHGPHTPGNRSEDCIQDHRLTLMPPDRRSRSLTSRTSRLRNSFFPSTISLLTGVCNNGNAVYLPI